MPARSYTTTAAANQSDLISFVLITTHVRKSDDARLNAALRQPTGSKLRDYAEYLRDELKELEAAEKNKPAESK